MSRRIRTAHYSQADRDRLAEAVTSARQNAGHRWRPAFAREIGISPRSLTAVEMGEPTVGQAVLEAIGRGLASQGWDQHTPRAILEGEAVPTPPAVAVGEETDVEVDEPEPDADLRPALQRIWRLVGGDRAEFWKLLGEAASEVQEVPPDSNTDRARAEESR